VNLFETTSKCQQKINESKYSVEVMIILGW